MCSQVGSPCSSHHASSHHVRLRQQMITWDRKFRNECFVDCSSLKNVESHLNMHGQSYCKESDQETFRKPFLWLRSCVSKTWLQVLKAIGTTGLEEGRTHKKNPGDRHRTRLFLNTNTSFKQGEWPTLGWAEQPRGVPKEWTHTRQPQELRCAPLVITASFHLWSSKPLRPARQKN